MPIVLGEPLDRTVYDQAVADVEQRYRANRIRSESVPSAVRAWSRRGYTSDPRLARWSAIPRLTLEDLNAFAADLAKRPYVITVVADLSRVDMKALAGLGALTKVDRADLKPSP